MTRIASVSVIRNAAFIAIALSFLGKFTALISTIPNAVLGGMSIPSLRSYRQQWFESFD